MTSRPDFSSKLYYHHTSTGDWCGASVHAAPVARGVQVAAGTTNFRGVADALIAELAKSHGFWAGCGTMVFTYERDVVVWFEVDGPGRKVNASWLRDGQWAGKDGVDISHLLPVGLDDGADRTVRQ
jgi:hypothetical protein